MEEQIKTIVNKLNNSPSFNLLPLIIFVVSIIIIVIYLIKIEIHSNGRNWERNKCSSKYVFFSGFLNPQGENGASKTMKNFQECIQRFS
jgi:hypothetical protein